MPTATFTTTAQSTQSVIPLKAASPSPSSSSSLPSTSTVATLRSLYNRAARAFLHRDVPLTHSLLTSAFSILHPPLSVVPDSLASHRRKWDILRITLQTTIYASHPQAPDASALPAALRESILQSPHTLIASLHSHSLELFTPASQKPSVAFLPSQILVTLVLSSLKLDCADVGRGIIEDWLAKRSIQIGDFQPDEGDGYEKVLEMYCLHVLPRLEEWDYAKEFLQYEDELPAEKREHMRSSLEKLHTQNTASRRAARSKSRSPVSLPSPSPESTSTTPSPRSASPASSSSSSSLSTASTHTAVPNLHQGGSSPLPLSSRITPSVSSASIASDKTVTNNRQRPSAHTAMANGDARAHRQHHQLAPPIATARPPSAPSALALIRASLAPYLSSLSLPKTATFLVLFVLLPLVSLVLRIRRRRRLVAGGSGSMSAAELARRRLANGSAVGSQSVVTRVWAEAVRAVVDTVKMGGRGLV